MNFAARNLILSTRNAHKAGEIRGVLAGPFRYFTLADFPDAPKVIEDADTFAGNARKKAAELSNWLRTNPEALAKPGLAPQESASFVLADDSGLEVDALGGAPGVHSARFAWLGTGRPGNAPDADNNAKLLRQLADVPWEKRTARFRCVIALAALTSSEPPGSDRTQHSFAVAERVELFDGACEGHVGFTTRGNGGFGYDPLFIPDGFEETFAELGEPTKNRISHRAQALEKLRKWFDQTTGRTGGG